MDQQQQATLRPPAGADERQPGEEVAALLAHEFRTPLTVLYSCLQLLDRCLPRDSDEPARRYLDEAWTEARQLTALTGQLVEATQIQGGSLPLHIVDVEIRPLVERSVEQAQSLARGQTIRLHMPAAPLVIRGDPTYLERAFMNLLVNAITYAPGTDQVDVRVTCHDHEVRIAVRDYGPGITPSRLERLSRAFYQPPRPDRPSRGGLGLSLFVTREVARLHAGRLEVASAEGRGSTFSLVLPLASAERRVSEPVQARGREPARSPAASAARPGRRSAGSARH